ncbi:MAG: signal peptidase II [Thermoleophilia bacterium]|nr:signal peptidase II [Thermoleophilia bacterium]
MGTRVGSTSPGPLAISVASRSVAARGFQWAAFLVVAASALAADQAAKRVAAAAIALGQHVHLASSVGLTHVRNSGIAFGLFAGRTTLIAIATAVAVAALLTWFARAGARHPLLPVAFGLLLGGSLSNLADRLRLGYVTDYLELPNWPSFNLADVFIVVGVAVLLAAHARTAP